MVPLNFFLDPGPISDYYYDNRKSESVDGEAGCDSWDSGKPRSALERLASSHCVDSTNSKLKLGEVSSG